MEGDKQKINPVSNTSKEGKKYEAGEGIRSMRSTSVFRAVNFELFMKPNKTIMALGLISITSCVIYLAYMNAQKENNLYRAVNEDNTVSLKTKKSKWDY